MSDEIEEEIDEAEPDDEVDEDIHSGSAYDEDFVCPLSLSPSPPLHFLFLFVYFILYILYLLSC